MSITIAHETRTTPEWAVSFLRDRCSELQAALTGSFQAVPGDEDDAVRRWNTLLVHTTDPVLLTDLERLQLLHARVAGRLERGGLSDIAPDVEGVVIALLVDRLQSLTDTVVAALPDHVGW